MPLRVARGLKSPLPLEELMPRLFGSDGRYAMLESLAHYLVGFTLVMKGIDLAEHFSRHPFTVMFLFCAGAFIILNAVFHHDIEKNEPHFTALFHVAEGVFLILIGIVLLEKDSLQPYFFFLAGTAYLALGVLELFRDAAEKKELLRFFLTVPATVFLAVAGVALAVNLLGANSTWVYFTAGVLAVSGMFIILVRKKARQDNEKQEKRRVDMLVIIIFTLGAIWAMGFFMFHFLRPLLGQRTFL